MLGINRESLLNRFIRYVKIETTSDPESTTFPSTSSQFDLARTLLSELKELGVKDVSLDENCYLMASIPSNMGSKIFHKIGFLAHLDTSSDVSGKNVNPQIIENYQGGDIKLGDSGIVIRESESSELRKCVGHTLVTTDGKTLLGADDKAGIAAIMTMVEYLHTHPQFKHGEIKIAFTPDEEIGRGVEKFDIKKFGADFAYTLDGEMSVNKETFSADAATITIQGKNIHPGKAKNIMTNAIKVANEVISRLPIHMSPETTEGYEPFIHPTDLVAEVGTAKIKFILRDFEEEGLIKQKNILQLIVEEVSRLYPHAEIKLTVTPTYRNMRARLEENPLILELMLAAVKDTGLDIELTPIRGGTDGSGLTAKGLPTPNLFYGGVDPHSKAEWLSLDMMEKAVETTLNIIRRSVS